MKVAILLVCVLAAATSVFAVDVKELAAVISKCKAETGFKGNGVESIKPEGAEKEEKCFLRCVMEAKGVLKSDGTLDAQVAKAYMEAKKMPADLVEAVMKTFEICSKEVKIDPADLCESAYKFFQCKMMKMKKN